MKVALVHDDLVQWGGAERVLVELSELFPDAPIYTSLYDSNNKSLSYYFQNRKIVTSFLQNIPFWKTFYKAFLPLYPISFEQFDLSEYDLVISQTTRFAKSINTKAETLHICYCHTPPRFLWNFSGEKHSFLLTPLLSKLRIFDQVSAKRVDHFIAGSFNCSSRIEKVYKTKSAVLQPFVDLDRFSNVESFEGGYYLIIARLTSYKRVDVVVKAFNKLTDRKLIVVGKGPQERDLKRIAGDNIQFVSNIPEAMLTNLLAGTKALIVSAEEDFGLTPLEAQALGKGVIAYKKGGALETVIDGKTGVFFDTQSEESLTEAILRFEKLSFSADNCINNANRFSKLKFIKDFKKILNSFNIDI